MSTSGGFFQWLVGNHVDTHPARRLVFVASGSAQVGTSMTAAALARASAANGWEALLIDPDNSQESLFGLSDSPIIGDTTDQPVLTLVAEGVMLAQVAPPPMAGAQPRTAEQQRASHRARLRKVAGMLPRYDIAIVDAGARFAELRTLMSAFGVGRTSSSDQLVVVTTPAPMHAASAYALIKYAATRPAAPRLHLVVNRADVNEGATVYARVDGASRRFLNRSVAYAGALPMDAEVAAEPRAAFSRGAGQMAFDADAGDLLRRLLPPLPIRNARQSRSHPSGN